MAKRVNIICPKCEGSRRSIIQWTTGASEICSRCKGKGKVSVLQRSKKEYLESRGLEGSWGI